MRSVATPEPVAPSRRLRSAAQAERERLQRELGRAEERLAAIRSEHERLLAIAERLRHRLALLAQLAYDEEEDSPIRVSESRLREQNLGSRQGEFAAPLGYLRGADIRVVAVRLLAATPSATGPIHYGRWYELLREAGYGVAGRDPLASFLTQVGRSPVVERAGEPGMYVLDIDVPGRLRERLGLLGEELVQLHEGQQTFEEIASARERRAELTSEYARLERALEEAIDALGLIGTGGEA